MATATGRIAGQAVEPARTVSGRQPDILNMRPLRSVRDLRDHVILHGDDGREWNTWLAAADGIDVLRGRQHFMSDARLSTEAALHNQGVALGDTITAGSLIAKGELIAPFDLNGAGQRRLLRRLPQRGRAAPIVKVFIDWLFSALESDPMPELQTSARTIIRARTPKVSAPGTPAEQGRFPARLLSRPRQTPGTEPEAPAT